MSDDPEKMVRLESWLDERLSRATAEFYAEQDRRLELEIEALEAAKREESDG